MFFAILLWVLCVVGAFIRGEQDGATYFIGMLVCMVMMKLISIEDRIPK